VGRVQQALRANASLSAYTINVREEGGRVVLTGRVRTAAEKDLAGLLARDAAGGTVDNSLSVGP
jgi:osmotically-inducible protein OsmY